MGREGGEGTVSGTAEDAEVLGLRQLCLAPQSQELAVYAPPGHVV